MKIEIVRNVQTVETIEVEFPYYYEHDLMLDHADVVIYGKIEENVHTCIEENKNYHSGELTYALKVESFRKSLSEYFEQDYASTKEEYESVKNRCVEFLSNF